MTVTYVPGRGMTTWDYERGCALTWRDGEWVPDTTSHPAAAVVELAGVIGEGSNTAANVRTLLARAGRRPVVLALDSVGGDVGEGLAIAGALARHGGVTARIRRANSIASVIAQACQRRIMLPRSEMMIHEVTGHVARDVRVDAAGLRSTAASLDRSAAVIAKAYAVRAGGTAQLWRQRMAAGTRYSPVAAVDAGLADEYI